APARRTARGSALRSPTGRRGSASSRRNDRVEAVTSGAGRNAGPVRFRGARLSCEGMRALAALAAVIAASSAGAATSSSGLRGLVMRGPNTPVCTAEQPCSEPAKNVTLVFSRNGQVVRRAKTNDQGRYRVALAPG